MCLDVGRLWTHKVGEFESNSFVVMTPLGSFQLHSQLVKFNWQEPDGHVTVERFGIGPTLHTIPVGQLFVH